MKLNYKCVILGISNDVFFSETGENRRTSRMFPSTAFPRIPYFGDDKSLQENEHAELCNTATPPAIPFDSLVQTAEAEKSELMTMELAENQQTLLRNSDSVERYKKVAASVKTEDAREFLAALVFLGTRSVSRTQPVSVDNIQ